MKIALCTQYHVFTGSGGAEKVFWNMANEFTNRGHSVIAIGFEEKTQKPFYEPHPLIKIFNAGLKFKTSEKLIKTWSCLHLGKNRRRACRNFWIEKEKSKRFTKILKQELPDIIISYQIEITYFLKGILNINLPIITMFHRPVNMLLYNNEKMFKALENSSSLQVLLPSYVKMFNSKLTPERVDIIPNIVPQYDEVCNRNFKTIIHVGRFDPNSKRQHLLIKAFAKIARKHPDWKVEFWGDKNCNINYYEYCLQLVKKLQLEKQVTFCGVTSNIQEKLSKASILAFPSAFEGFPLALTEAMSIGLPAIGYKTCSAVNELIKNEHNGLLVDDGIDTFATALEKLIMDPNLRNKLGHQAHLDMKPYAPKVIWDQWEQLCLTLVSNFNKTTNN